VRGSYRPNTPLLSIASFRSRLSVFASKQRPRRIVIVGSDGRDYRFLLKGHEDLRQDERVMQLLQLVNTLLGAERIQGKQDLQIARYAVIPLSPESGLLGWVPHSDTIQDMVMNYRRSMNVVARTEVLIAQGEAPDYDNLPLIQKIDTFKHTLSQTTGMDLYKALWLQSSSSEVWLNRRSAFTQSVAANSMVGYILGLGDRHPSNLMIDQVSGQVIHIDYGDCFEVAMDREKFPEKVPFRLTRMLVNGMEASGIEGNFRTTCVEVLHVIRTHAQSVEAMLQAFLHDPLINWRLLEPTGSKRRESKSSKQKQDSPTNRLRSSTMSALEGHFVDSSAQRLASVRVNAAPLLNTPGATQLQVRRTESTVAGPDEEEAESAINERAQKVKARIDLKLSGKDAPKPLPPVIVKTATKMSKKDFRIRRIVGGFGEVEQFAASEEEEVSAQVDRLIAQATSHENLCQHFTGWCPFW